MNRCILAITTCRVSTPEQVLNNSLGRQAAAVIQAAKDLGATIPEDGQWSGHVSSKAGTNVNRPDLKEMLTYCKRHPQVKYLIVHEVDRFMGSIEELFYFEVEFKKLGVMVWYASQPELNTNDYKSKLFKALEAFKGEGSNVERINKSIDGQTTALQQGRYPFAPKPGYRRGYEKGVQEVHEVRGPILRSTLVSIASRLVTPTQALIALNKSEFAISRAPYKMDKFRHIVTDPFYAGIVEINKQVKVRNENGLHEALITKDQHYELIQIMDGRKKTQAGPRKNGNPKYPLSNLVNCQNCIDKTNGRYVGFDHGNGKNPKLVYEKYRCRACKRYLTLQELHPMIEQQFKDHPITDAGLEDLLKALDTVWKQQEGQVAQEATRLKQRIKVLNDSILTKVDAAMDPSNVSIKQEILISIAKQKEEIVDVEDRLYKLKGIADTDRDRFLKFAFDFVDNMGNKFLEISPENRLGCKQIVFPAGFYLDAKNKVYTPKISSLYRLADNKKAPGLSSEALLVRVRGL